jgi:hypothetical protein
MHILPFSLFRSIVTPLAILLGAWLARRNHGTSSAELEASFYRYWPSLRVGLVCEAMVIILGPFLLKHYAMLCLLLSIGFWVFAFVLTMVRPYPRAIERQIIAFFPLVIFSTFCSLELHHTH